MIANPIFISGLNIDSLAFGKVSHFTLTAIYGNPKNGMHSILNVDKGRGVWSTIEDIQYNRNVNDIP